MKFRFLPVYGIMALLPFTLSSQKSPVKIAIVGGGMAGVSAAHHIREIDAEASITIFEKEKVLGGNARTISVMNADKEWVNVDAGPQYFTEGPWDEYLQFLKQNGVYNGEKVSEFVGSISIQNEASKRPVLITPLNGSFRGEKIGKLLRLKRFFDTAFNVYQNPKGSHAAAIGNWVKEMDTDLEFKQQVVLPFLAASLGTSIDEIKQTSTSDIVKLFAFRRPSPKSTFKVMHEGMGTLIQNIGKNLAQKDVRVLCSSPVKKLHMDAEGNYVVSYADNESTQEETFDFVVLAVHADQAHKIVKDENRLAEIAAILKNFEYFKARIVLHNDPSLVNVQRPAFLNVLTTIDNQIAANTMNLEMIDRRYKGIYKSWLTEELATKLKLSGHFLHEEIFWHPLITPKFNESLSALNMAVQKLDGLCFAGGWSQGLETQETAVISGKKAAEKYAAYVGNKLVQK